HIPVTMANQGNNSKDIFYSALYDGEEYRPWNDMAPNAREHSRANRTRLENGSSFLDVTPTWGDVRRDGMTRASSQGSAQPHTLGTLSPDLQCPGSYIEHNIKLQWEGRALELGMYGSDVLTPMQELTGVHSALSGCEPRKKDNTVHYPKWNLEESTVSFDPGLWHHYIEERETSPDAEHRTQSSSSLSGSTNKNWELNASYSDIQNPPVKEKLRETPYHDKPLVDRMDQFYTGIPEERRFDDDTGSPSGMNSNVERPSPGQRTGEIVTIATNEGEKKSTEQERETGASEDWDLDTHADIHCSCETNDEIEESGETSGNNVECPSDGRRTLRRKRPNMQTNEDETTVLLYP
ncbi:hypothetical protein QZH41_014193, partial [Actinostola sp. cb2023]